MITNKKLLIPTSALFLLIQAWFSLQIQTVTPDLVRSYQFSSVVLACTFCALFFEISQKYALTQIALIFTVFSDYFLVYIDQQNQLGGMICFSVVQIAYFLRLLLEDENEQRRKIHLIVRAVLSVIATIVPFAVLQQKTDALALISVFYYANLLLNLVFAFINFKKVPLMAVGFLCFVLCDTVIGLANIGPYFSINEGSFVHKLLHPGFDPAWAFYVPSFTLLSISLLPERLKK